MVHGMHPAGLAVLLGVTISTVSKWENEKKEIGEVPSETTGRGYRYPNVPAPMTDSQATLVRYETKKADRKRVLQRHAEQFVWCENRSQQRP